MNDQKIGFTGRDLAIRIVVGCVVFIAILAAFSS
jgi:hypothetical protein